MFRKMSLYKIYSRMKKYAYGFFFSKLFVRLQGTTYKIILLYRVLILRVVYSCARLLVIFKYYYMYTIV